MHRESLSHKQKVSEERFRRRKQYGKILSTRDQPSESAKAAFYHKPYYKIER